MSASSSSETGSRHRPHWPETGAETVPVTSTPSVTDSSRSSSVSGAPSGTPMTSRPSPVGAGTLRRYSLSDPGRRPSSRRSNANGLRPRAGWGGIGVVFSGIPGRPDRVEAVVQPIRAAHSGRNRRYFLGFRLLLGPGVGPALGERGPPLLGGLGGAV